MTFKEQILNGIPDQLPELKKRDHNISHAPKRNIKGVLSKHERLLAVENALRYFPSKFHNELDK